MLDITRTTMANAAAKKAAAGKSPFVTSPFQSFFTANQII
jgi:hypothetical protein